MSGSQWKPPALPVVPHYFNANGGAYYDYPTGSNSVPDGIDFAGDTTFDAVFFDRWSNLQPNDITNVGVLSPYGTAGQGGNVDEWEETAFDLKNDFSASARGVRGGSWSRAFSTLSAQHRRFVDPRAELNFIGFRVASVIPEPSTALLAVAGLVILFRRSRL